ncbi:MAG TPA: alpha/beta hydrolase [Acidimicrobiales bacterium]|nr:alpha/beta hydrolase [Acidimicrobiales bacterium]
MDPDSNGVQRTTVTTSDMEFTCLEAGSGPLALCLHGFPDSAMTWRHLLPALAEAGFHAVAPWMRGYSPTPVAPDGWYQTGVLGRDACRLHEALGGGDDAVIIGHDWGAAATYVAANHDPDRWRRVVTLAVPPSGALGDAFFRYRQIRRSSYMFIFQSPLAEMIVPANDWEFIRGLWSDWSPGYDAGDDVDHVIDALSPEGHLSAALGYYRAQFQPELQSPELADWQAAAGGAPSQPTLYLHGVEDGCMGVELVRGRTDILGEGSQMKLIEGAGHFLHLEAPEEVNGLIVEWLS